jgi:hypothetical protein
MRGLPREFYKKIDDTFKNITDKLELDNELSEKSKKLNVSSHKFLNIAKNILGRTRIAYNIGPLKDTLLLKFIEKTKIFKRPINWLAEKFEQIACRKSRKSYEGTFHRIEAATAQYRRINKELLNENPDKEVTIERIKGQKIVQETKTVSEWVKELEIRTQNVRDSYINNFLQTAREDRLSKTKEEFSTLHPKIWDMTFKKAQNFINPNNELYRSFISETLANKFKINRKNAVILCKKTITSDIKDTYLAMADLLNSIQTAPKDFETRKCIKEIRNTLVNYKNLAGSTENSERNELTKTLKKQLGSLSMSFQKYGYKSDDLAQTQSYIHNMSKIIEGNKKGEFQEILTIYKQLCPDKYQIVKKNTYKAVDSLNKSIDIETNKLFDKLRDIAIGSVPGDALSVITSLGLVGTGLAKADNNDERVSVALRYGIPVVGAVATSVLCTVGLISGGTAIVLGLISGEVIHKIGAVTDNEIKKLKEKHLSLKDINEYIKNQTVQTAQNIKEANETTST